VPIDWELEIILWFFKYLPGTGAGRYAATPSDIERRSSKILAIRKKSRNKGG
jgi:hypothetical protein